MDKNNLQEKKPAENSAKLIEGIDFYFENGLMVLTALYLKKRGYCCGNGCRHCPYLKESGDQL
ncbi:MAG TPA: DUF5522 domain-containing protein [Pyrinomonadaceae bacterium]|jgi:hypothetical protein|nr:DUF5522 domain-containing protein [Pyrinomonadaceae bacterium]